MTTLRGPPRRKRRPCRRSDLCVLCEATLSDFLRMGSAAGGRTVLRLELLHAAPASAAMLAEGAEWDLLLLLLLLLLPLFFLLLFLLLCPGRARAVEK